MMVSKDAAAAWYREPWVWLLIAIPMTAVGLGVAILWLSIISDDGLVVDDYYRRGKEINRVLKRDQAAATHGVRAALDFNFTDRTVYSALQAHAGFTLPDEVRMRFLHATRAGLDKSVVLLRTPKGNYFSVLPALARGRWYLQLEAQDWRLSGSFSYPQQRTVLLFPASDGTDSIAIDSTP